MKRPKLTRCDRAFWVLLSRLWPRWQDALMLVKPATVIGWHRKGFALYWTWKSRTPERCWCASQQQESATLTSTT